MNTDLRPGLLVATTTPETAWVLMAGQLRAFADAGFRVELVSSPGELLDRTGKREGVNTHPVLMSRRISPIADAGAVLRLYRLIRRLDVALSYVGTPKAGLVVGIACALARVPRRVYLLRGLRVESAHGISRALLWLAEWLAIHCAHEVIVVSESLRARAIGLHLLGRRQALLLGRGSSNGVDLDRFTDTVEAQSRGAQFRADYGLTGDQFAFGFVGRLTEDKGIYDLLEAFDRVGKRYPQAVLMVVGAPQTPNDEALIRALINQRAGVMLLGYLEDPAAFYAAIDCLVLPTYREGFPNVALEAAACSRPVIASDATGALDAVVPGRTGLRVRAGSADDLADAMLTVLQNPDSAQEMGLHGRRFVESHYAQARVQGAIVARLVELTKRPIDLRHRRDSPEHPVASNGLDP